MPALAPLPQVHEIGHILSIQSDATGPGNLRVFDVELRAGKNNELLFVNFHLRGLIERDLPEGGGYGTAADREALCDKNSKGRKENCTTDLEQLKSSGIVIERLIERPGMTLKAESDFSATQGGNLVLNYIRSATDFTNPKLDVVAEFRLRLEPAQYGWIILSPLHPDVGVVGAPQLNSAFSNFFAVGFESIQVGTDENKLW
jgi:hypothetical protein